MKNRTISFILLLLFLGWLFIGTGLHSDDYVHLETVPGWTTEQLITVDVANHPAYYFYLPVLYFDFFQFRFFGDRFLLYDIVKVLTSFLCILLVYKFSYDYLSPGQAFLFSCLFILYPIHDATNFWVIGQYMIITAALVMTAHRLIRNDRFVSGFAVGLLGSFCSYAAPPYFFGLSLIFILKREFKKAALFVAPQIIYIVYYIAVKRAIGFTDYRTRDITAFTAVAKRFVIQLGSFLDASIGPSFVLKIIGSITALSLPSVLIGFLIVFLWRKQSTEEATRLPADLLISFALVAVLAFGLFALTGLYPQLAFNLGNRTTIFGSLLLALLVSAFIYSRRKGSSIVLAIVVLSILGLSDHWKDWNVHQLLVIENIRGNAKLRQLQPDQAVFVTGNQYSQLGLLNHIEFFSESWVTRLVFQHALNERRNASTLNRRFSVSGDTLVDRKYDEKITVDSRVIVYDSEADKVESIPRDALQQRIDNLPEDKRHWIQLLDEKSWVRRLLVRMMPRLAYAL